MEDKITTLESIVAQLQNEVEELKGGDRASSETEMGMPEQREGLYTKYKELLQKVEKIEGNLGVDKIVLTDVGDKVLVTVQTPLGSVPVTLPHTTNTSAKSSGKAGTLDTSHISGSAVAVAPTFTAMKGGPPAGMTTEQLQDFKKQTLQINQLLQKVKDLEIRILDANGLIKKGEDVTTDLATKVSEDVKEIYTYLDDINTTMSQKIAAQRVEMEKLAGDTPQPINYDPFNYGEAYAGDVVDFEARKRIVEIDLLFQSLQVAMNQMKDSVRVSPAIDLGYKVVRLDQLVESTGFGHAIRTGELTTDNGLVINQASKIEAPERRYPRKEAFQTDEEKEYQWSITDSIMQTMYRLEMEIAQMQKVVVKDDARCSVNLNEDVGTAFKNLKSGENLDEQSIKALIEKECKQILNFRPSFPTNERDIQSFGIMKSFEPFADGSTDVPNTAGVTEQIRLLEVQVEALLKSNAGKPAAKPQARTSFNPYTDKLCNRLDSFYKQPVKLRYLLQRAFKLHKAEDEKALYQLPRPVGIGYERPWLQPPAQTDPGNSQDQDKQESRALRDIMRADNIASLVEPQTEECSIKGKDGRWYKGDKATRKDVKTRHKEKSKPVKLSIP